ncbi:hypothetical protein BP6252_13396 [Coleophoma cylindrospora]|uniref:Uncharacterized protein n=1 Tax=Coleophoma cylindrospora TaxID=1849047 RepID=A0A3D8Q826_9HELO|nr:hypothetical protein BP6252_13396 [Coleophoma cylindrospora]
MYEKRITMQSCTADRNNDARRYDGIEGEAAAEEVEDQKSEREQEGTKATSGAWRCACAWGGGSDLRVPERQSTQHYLSNPPACWCWWLVLGHPLATASTQESQDTKVSNEAKAKHSTGQYTEVAQPSFIGILRTVIRRQSTTRYSDVRAILA